MNDLTKVRKSVMEETQVLPEMAGQIGKVLSNNGFMPRWVIGRYVGELVRVSMDIAPPGCFALDGSTIVNGKNDFAELANCGSRFITISGNNLILADCVDFGRGKGSSGRSVGSFEGDGSRSITGSYVTPRVHDDGKFLTTGCFSSYKTGAPIFFTNTTGYEEHVINFDSSKVVPTAPENRPKSLTELVCIYHGVL